MSENRTPHDVIRVWESVEKIHFGRVRADEREALLEFVESPFKSAVGIMFDKHVPTVGSSCNLRDYVEGKAWITVDYDFMTSRNKKVVDRHETVEKFTVLNQNIGRVVTVAGLLFPIQALELPEEIGERAKDIAEQFYEQPDFLPKDI